MKKPRIGVLGSGQLGQMMAEVTLRHEIPMVSYSPDIESPMSHLGVKVIEGEFDDTDRILQFLSQIDILTFEFENIPSRTLQFLNESQNTNSVLIYPPPNALLIAQDRLLEKNHFQSLGFKTPQYYHLTSANRSPQIEFPLIVKTIRFGYDGKGQSQIKNENEWQSFLGFAFSNPESEYIVEEKIQFQKEASVILTRFVDGSIYDYGVVENQHKNHILDLSIFPADIDKTLAKKMQSIAHTLANSLEYIGTMGVEFFLTENEVYLNEFAPRPHNSGHFSQDCGSISQFKLHILAILGEKPKLPLHPNPTLMKNILGNDYEHSISIANKLLADERYELHLYGKKIAKQGRKMGHMNFKGKLDEVSELFFEL
ncbi:phosphoribosylaminoimidazole carboxylase, ATPase subunit [Leptospira ryugenii]|uniref:N5-carboxyaminoimidazole ribonucleotide synthase n=1 Tax=Leptospira ryugenii TaxID=1917863 RepID=A0A2P2DWY3_9LEPT|nr:ATP-grasp domain-containing protein [Leptospira ryugenii]GBF49144.1 phosphoribosylaminoimidazole carboxylase, ATPase subunit [Leptospira ryugenii]